MKAIVLCSPGKLELTDIPRFKLVAKNHVQVKVRACGICGSDLRYYAGQNPWALHTLGRHVENPPNMILGHEFAGEVVEVNAREHEHLLGKSVAVQSYRSCGTCAFCLSGKQNLCRDTIHAGHAQGWGKMEYYPGAYSEYCIGWADMLYPIDDCIGFGEAAMADILCVAVHANGCVKKIAGADILCIGGGPAGLSAAQVALVKGAAKVVILELSPIARDIISHYEGITVVDPGDSSSDEVLRGSTSTGNYSVIYDSVGSNETFAAALELLSESGTYVNLAVHDTELSFNAKNMGSERTITSSSNAFDRDIEEAVELLVSGKVDVGPWVTHRFPLEDFQTAFDLLLSEPKQAYKVVFEPWKGGG